MATVVGGGLMAGVQYGGGSGCTFYAVRCCARFACEHVQIEMNGVILLRTVEHLMLFYVTWLGFGISQLPSQE